MKNKLFLLAALVALAPNAGWGAKVKLCTTMLSWAQTCQPGQYCCPNGNYMVDYRCPDGWLHNTITHTCSRTGTTGLSDSKGYYTQEYGTCNAFEFQSDCCDISTSGSVQCVACAPEIQ